MKCNLPGTGDAIGIMYSRTSSWEDNMRALVDITIITGLILVMSTVPSHSHGVNWGVSVNLGVPAYDTYAPVYPVYPAYVYYPPPPVYPLYGAGVVAPAHHFHGRFYNRPYHPYYYRHYWR
jgi:hypothetical protein